MAVFTVQLGEIIEDGFDIGLQDYPIFDESHRKILNKKILDHYYFREIGMETPELFKRFINRKMHEIMPLYNKLYLSELELDKNTFTNVDVKSKTRQKTKSTAEGESERSDNSYTDGETSTTSKSRTTQSNMPQMQARGYEDYLANSADSVSESEGDTKNVVVTNGEDSNKAVSETINTYINTVVGLQGITKAQAVAQYRATVLNIDMLVIDELSSCFMGIWRHDFGAF